MNLWLIVRPLLSRLVRFFHISLIEARSERSSSRLGILWAPLSTLIFAGLLTGVFHQQPLREAGDFFLFVLSGYVLWNFITATVTTSTTVVQRRYDFAVHNNLTLVGLFFKLLIDRLFAMGLNLILLLGCLVIVKPQTIGLQLLLLPAMLLIMALVSLAIAYLVNVAVIFFPDLDAVFNVAMRLLFFASPVFWSAEAQGTGVRAILATYNPISHYLSVFRQCFGIVPFEPMAWAVTLSLSLILCVAGTATYRLTADFIRNLR